MLVPFLFLLGGLVGLLFAADIFVKGSVSLARRIRLPDILIGTTIVAIGTSAPELFINITASKLSAGDIVVSNIIGSNIVNICLGLGIASLIIEIPCGGKRTRANLILGVSPIIGIISLVAINPADPTITLTIGILLLLVFVIFMWSNVEREDSFDLGEESISIVRAVIYLISGAIALPLLGSLVVNNAVFIAEALNVPQAVIGATIIAAGGSLPEVAACFAAARINRPSVALGNVIGSQAFNALGILGVSACISPVRYSSRIVVDASLLVFVTLVILAVYYFGRRTLTKKVGVGLVGIYGAYLLYLVFVAMQ